MLLLKHLKNLPSDAEISRFLEGNDKYTMTKITIILLSMISRQNLLFHIVRKQKPHRLLNSFVSKIKFGTAPRPTYPLDPTVLIAVDLYRDLLTFASLKAVYVFSATFSLVVFLNKDLTSPP
jgi:hypothetical protein